MNKEMKAKLKQIEEERDKYEIYLNTAQYEKKQKDDQIKHLEQLLAIKCPRRDMASSLHLGEIEKLKEQVECETKLRQKMADKVGELQKRLDVEEKRAEELKFIRENDNIEVIRLEGQIQELLDTVEKLEQENKELRNGNQSQEK